MWYFLDFWFYRSFIVDWITIEEELPKFSRKTTKHLVDENREIVFFDPQISLLVIYAFCPSRH